MLTNFWILSSSLLKLGELWEVRVLTTMNGILNLESLLLGLHGKEYTVGKPSARRGARAWFRGIPTNSEKVIEFQSFFYE